MKKVKKKSDVGIGNAPNLASVIREAREACKAIRDDAARTLGILDRMEPGDPDGKLSERMHAVGGRVRRFVRDGSRYATALQWVQRLAATM